MVLAALLGSGCSDSGSEAKPTKASPAPPPAAWVLRDSAPYNLTTLDPVGMVDAFSINVLANVYEGLVATAPDGSIIPALAEKWEITGDGRIWTFHLRPDARFHPPRDRADLAAFARPATAQDVVYSLNRASFAKDSFYGWFLAGLLAEDAKVDFEQGGRHPDIKALDERTVEITLTRPFPLLNRLVTVGGWVYPEHIASEGGSKVLAQVTVGTGPYRLSRFVPDDRIDLERTIHWQDAGNARGPHGVSIRVVSDPVAALESFRAGQLDCVELDLGTLRPGMAIAAQGGGRVVQHTANYLDYIVLNCSQAPFDDIRIREALNLAIDRDALGRALGEIAEPAYGFIPPLSPAFRGGAEIRKVGFAHSPAKARDLVAGYLAETGQKSLSLELVCDTGEFPDTIMQFVQAEWRRNLPELSVTLRRVTWPELLQRAFSGQGTFYRFWWNIVTPSEDLYFLFYFPGQNPPGGFNLSFYGNPEFAPAYFQAFSELDPRLRMAQVRKLEDFLIRDSAAIPLLHRRYSFLLRADVRLPMNGYLRKYYMDAERSPAPAST